MSRSYFYAILCDQKLVISCLSIWIMSNDYTSASLLLLSCSLALSLSRSCLARSAGEGAKIQKYMSESLFLVGLEKKYFLSPLQIVKDSPKEILRRNLIQTG